MSLFPQVSIATLIFLVIIGTLVSPELKPYSAQLVALLLLFYIILKHIQGRTHKQEVRQARADEDTLLFLSTYLKPKIEAMIDLTHHEENREILKKQLQLMQRETEKYLEEKEHDLNH